MSSTLSSGALCAAAGGALVTSSSCAVTTSGDTCRSAHGRDCDSCLDDVTGDCAFQVASDRCVTVVPNVTEFLSAVGELLPSGSADDCPEPEEADTPGNDPRGSGDDDDGSGGSSGPSAKDTVLNFLDSEIVGVRALYLVLAGVIVLSLCCGFCCIYTKAKKNQRRAHGGAAPSTYRRSRDVSMDTRRDSRQDTRRLAESKDDDGDVFAW
jgi:hypothetical protein